MNTNNQNEQQLWHMVMRDLYTKTNPAQREKHRKYCQVIDFYHTNKPKSIENGARPKKHGKQ